MPTARNGFGEVFRVSISQFQEKFLSKGCAAAIGIVMSLVFVASAFYQCGQANQASGGPATQVAGTIATVAGQPLTAQEVDQAIEAQKQQFSMQLQGMALPPEQEAEMAAGAVGRLVQSAAGRAVAKESGVVVTEESARAYLKKKFDEALAMEKEALVNEKKLKPTASEAELDKAIKAKYGKTLTEIRGEQDKQITDAFKDPAKKEQLIGALSTAMLRDKMVAEATPSEAELRKSYDSLTIKRILIKDAPGTDPMSQATRIEAEIRGGLSFESAMNKYSQETPLPGKKVGENQLILTGRQLTEEAYKPLAGVAAGAVTPPVRVPEGVVLYKLISVKNELPADFEKKKSDYLKQYAESTADAKLQEKVKAVTEGTGLKWSSKAYEALYDLGQLGMAFDPEKRTQSLVRILANAKQAATEPGAAKIGALAYFAAANQLAQTDKAKYGADRKAAIVQLLEVQEDQSLRMQLIDALAEEKDAVGVSDNLLKAAQFNSDYSPQGQAKYGELQAKLRALKEQKLVNAEAEKGIQAELARWRKGKIDADKAEAEMKRQMEEEAKKAQAEAKKADASAPKPKTP
ncbi:MAG: SurA N-terminal domain-containing protein [Fimbriimonadaceae bacterium]|nr:SurA N-terminal domain-containing protein [Fimbriimonadaceae bacterium]